MLFISHYTLKPESRDAALNRFQKTGGPPPAGVTMLGRWHAASGNEGWILSETDDAAAQAAWILEWSDHLEFRITPVIDDERFAHLLSQAQ